MRFNVKNYNMLFRSVANGATVWLRENWSSWNQLMSSADVDLAPKPRAESDEL